MNNSGWEMGVHDPARLAALASTGLFGTDPEDSFDRLTELAAGLIGVSRACITLVDAELSWAKSALGYPQGTKLAAPVALSFCRYVVGTGRPLIVEDARRDPRTRGDPAIELFDAAAWAGFPVEDGSGAVLGTLCVLDSEPREWTSEDLHVLATLARAASSEIALRRCQADLAEARKETAALRLAIARSAKE